MKKTSLDILIPSYRVSEHHLLRMLNISKPASLKVRFVIVLDNPAVEISPNLKQRFAESDVVLIHNLENKGAPISRNIALEASNAEWVLFWDDDIIPNNKILFEYAFAVERKDYADGFVGPTNTPAPCNTFTSGILASDILTFWHLPRGYDQLSWGITANLLIRRDVVSDLRFLPIFPKNGGGEDIDFCLRVFTNTDNLINVIWQAEVLHEWWDNGRRSYTRFIRWAYGDSVLPSLFPRYRYYNFPNVVEFFMLCGMVALFLGKDCFFAAIGGGALGEFFVEWAKQVIIKKNYSPIIAFESSLVRASNDLGRFIAHVKNIRPIGFMERFDYFCDGKHVRHERIVAAFKFAAFVIFTWMIFYSNY